jgi:hypothetical protein
LRHLELAGERRRDLMDHSMRNLSLDHLELDEIWTFFCRRQRSLRITPTMAAGVTHHLGNLAELLSGGAL